MVPHFTPGGVYRAEEVVTIAGGKGLNVARTVRALGEPVRVVGFLGGGPADFVRSRCAELGIAAHWVETADDSRTCVIVIDPAAERQTVVNEPGPRVDAQAVAALREALLTRIGPDDLLCISGSAPPSVPASFYSELIAEGQQRGARVLVDVAGETLRRALASRPWAISPNQQEARAAGVAGGTPLSLVLDLATHAHHVLLTLGEEGLLYACGTEAWWLHSPPVHAINAVGSGDACAGGFLTGVGRGLPPLDAARLGVACGAASAARLEPSVGSVSEVEVLTEQVRVERLA